LAVQSAPPWPKTVSAHDEASLAWYERTQMPLFAWSARASGFFSGRHNPEVDVERVYESEANREWLRRAHELGKQKGATAAEVAQAWVLARPFPVCAIIGPRNVEELRASVAAVELELTPREARWLGLQGEEDG
jgi:1-deoxyxylulose-5-phosphate synthase